MSDADTNHHKRWSREQDDDVVSMRPADVAERYGRSIRSVYERRRYLKRLHPNYNVNIVSNRLDIPVDVLSERDRRAQLAPRDTTAVVCGDPLPGYSAFDKYQQDTVSA